MHDIPKIPSRRLLKTGVIAATLALAGAAGAALFDGEPGEETRSLGVFTGVECPVSGEFEFVRADECSLRIEAPKDVIRSLQTEIKDGTLVVTLGSPRDSGVKFIVSAPALHKIALGGGGDPRIHVSSRSAIRSPALHLAVAGRLSGEVEIDTPKLSTHVAGGGQLGLKGRAEEHKIRVSGDVRIEAASLAASDVDVQVSGSSVLKLDAEQTLSVLVNGSAKVLYRGEPKIRGLKVNGSGKVEKL